MLTLGNNDSIAGSATNAATVNCTIMGVTTDASTPPISGQYDVLYQGQIAASMTAMYTAGASAPALISAIHLYNTGTSTQTVTLAVNGTASTNTICTLSIPNKGWANYEDGQGWTVFASSGLIVGTAGVPGGLGTPDTAAVSLTASTVSMVTGTKISIPTGQQFIGLRYRFELVVTKTAAGTATWALTVRYGTAGTTSDALIASWTSGTNTAAIDKATIGIEVVILTLGASATAACTAMYVNRLTDVTGLGDIAIAPTSTATFDSTVTSPFMHVDITPGASAVMTAAGSAERLV